MDSFRATLEEVTEADALLHVVDLSHPAAKSDSFSNEHFIRNTGDSGPANCLKQD